APAPLSPGDRRTWFNAIRPSSAPIWGPAMSLLSIRKVSVSYDKVVALDDVSLDLAPGELVALVGASGAGKSTLMKAIIRFVRPVSGTVEFEGRSLLSREPHEIARLGIAYVPE